MICTSCQKRPTIEFSNLCYICNSIVESETVHINHSDIELENEHIEFFSVANMSFKEALTYL